MSQRLTVLDATRLITLTSSHRGVDDCPLVLDWRCARAQEILTHYSELLVEGNATLVERTDARTVMMVGKGEYASRHTITWATAAEIEHAYERGNVRCDWRR